MSVLAGSKNDKVQPLVAKEVMKNGKVKIASNAIVRPHSLTWLTQISGNYCTYNGMK